MNLQTTIDIYAGGEGSGCHGPNCGRPSTGAINYTAEKTGGQAGSNPGGRYRGSDGIERYVKFYKNPAQGRGEALANTIYNDLGIKAPKSTIVNVGGREAFASEIVKNKEGTLEDVGNKTKYADKILDGFAADVLVGNWDVVGLTYDNILIDKAGDVHRIDNGGSLLYRAQGSPKPEGLLNKITEYDGLFNPSVNHEFASLMKKAGYTSADQLGSRIKAQVDRIVGLQKKYGGWDGYIEEKAPYVKGAERSRIAEMLTSRTKLLQQKVSSIKAGGVGSGCRGENCGRPPLGIHEDGKTRVILGKEIFKAGQEELDQISTWDKHPLVFHSSVKLGQWQSEHPDKAMIAERATDAADVGKAILDNDTRNVYVVRSEGKVIGALQLAILDKKQEVYVERLATHPAVIAGEIKAKGIGTALMIQAAKIAAEKGYRVSLYALEGARTFYQQLGMRKSMVSTYSWSSSQAKAFAEYGDKIAAMSRDEVEMNIRQAIEFESKNPILIGKLKEEMEAGGPGSGCQGPNCGRPATGEQYHGTSMAAIKSIMKTGIKTTDTTLGYKAAFATPSLDLAFSYGVGAASKKGELKPGTMVAICVIKDPAAAGMTMLADNVSISHGKIRPEFIDRIEVYPWNAKKGSKPAQVIRAAGEVDDSGAMYVVLHFPPKEGQEDAETATDIQAFIRKEGSQHCVKSHSGKNLGCYPSKGGAKKRLAQVEYFKHLKGGGEGSGCQGPNCGRKASGRKLTQDSIFEVMPHKQFSAKDLVREAKKNGYDAKEDDVQDLLDSLTGYELAKHGDTYTRQAVYAGGPGSGRKPEGGKSYADLDPVKQHERARLNPKQKSIFGPGHTKEIISHPDQVKKSVKQQVSSLEFDKDGEPMVGNMARNTRTEPNDWFDPTRRRGEKNTRAISSGGEGSGCHGPNCGRPSTGGKSTSDGKGMSFGKIKTPAQVLKMVQKLGAKKMIHVDYWDTKEIWEECRDIGESCKQVSALAKAYQAMGLSPHHMAQYQDMLSKWTESSSKKFTNVAQQVIAGKLKSPMARAMVIDWAITQAGIKGKSVTLYRGVGGEYANNTLRAALKAKDTEIVLKSRGADSWADSRSEAASFGSVILVQDVPKQYLISSWKTNSELDHMGEREFIVAYPKGKIRLDRSRIQLDLESAGVVVKKKTVEIDLTDDQNANWLHSKTRRALKKLKGMGEPDIPDFGTAYMDPKTTFHPPSLQNPDRVPADDPKETNDKYLDVTKRKEAQKQRANILKRGIPGGNPPLIPIGTTAMNNPAGVSNPIVMMSQAQKPKKIIQRPAKPMGGKRTSIPLGRSY